jgi:parallel beta-helix repeat protein
MRKGVALLLVLVLTVFYAIMFLPVSAEARMIVVPDDYPTIQAAIDSASAGDTVYVKKGTYKLTGGRNDAIRIDKPLSLIGEDSQKTVITPSYIHSTHNVIGIAADNVTISGFTIRGNRDLNGIRIDPNSPDQPSGIKIIGNNIASSLWGILTYGGENYVISQNNITGSHVYGIVVSSSNSVISDNNISGNVVGMSIVLCANVTVSGNSITGNGVGLNLRWDGPFYVYGNNITDNQGYGVQFAEGCGNSLVYNNNIMRNGLGISLLNSASDGADNKVYYNNIVDNAQNALVQQNVTDVVLWDNGNVGVGSGIVWDNGSIGNYWVHYEGADGNGDGIGDTPYMISSEAQDRFPLMNPWNPAVPYDTVPPRISFSSPAYKVYNDSSVPLIFSTYEPVSSLSFSLDGQDNVTIAGNTTLSDLPNGFHNLKVYITDRSGNTGVSLPIHFTIAEPEPFPTTLVAASAATLAVVGAGLLVYFKKRKR